MANTANAGAAAIASANPPATASRHTGLLIVAMLISCQFAVLLYARSLCKRSPPRRCYKDRPDLDIRRGDQRVRRVRECLGAAAAPDFAGPVFRMRRRPPRIGILPSGGLVARLGEEKHEALCGAMPPWFDT
ncbi:MAG TPA: hypothetical protein PLI79_04015 [Mycobacterium sp.]|nr:hypothetical protein [Mycobacterium sp.]